MKILHISSEPPSEFSGGGKVVLQTLISLYEKNTIDYLGPEIENERIENYYSKVYFLNKNKNKFLQIKNLLCGITSSFYIDFKRKKIDYSYYDLIILEFTKFDFVIDEILKVQKNILVRVHNVELDYCSNNYKNKRNLKNLVLSKLAYKKEKNILIKSKYIVTLTKKDKLRIQDLYNIDANNISIIPVSMESYGEMKNKKIENDNILLTGSLWYGPNSRGIEWFLNNIPKAFDKEIIVAGSNPSEKIIELSEKRKNIRLIKNPLKIDVFFKECSIYIAPIFDGAGMKVKVGEALANKMIVIGSTHSFIGYNDEGEFDDFIFKDFNELIKILEGVYNLSILERENIVQKNYMIYKKKFSVESSTEKFSKIVEHITNE